MRRFGGPDKEMRSISRADKLRVKAGVRIEHKPLCGLPLLGAPVALLITRDEAELLLPRSANRPVMCRTLLIFN
jgi:hypothetical protein